MGIVYNGDPIDENSGFSTGYGLNPPAIAYQIIKTPNNNEAQAHIMQLTTHFVSPWARGYGLARKLLQRAEKQAKNDGATVINLDVRETQDAAIKLYESEEYDQFATHPAYAYVNGSFVPGRYYMKLLEEG